MQTGYEYKISARNVMENDMENDYTCSYNEILLYLKYIC